MNLFELVNKILRLFKCVRDYQGDVGIAVSSVEHIAFGMFTTPTIALFATVWIWCLIAYPIALGYYAFFVELVLDRDKNKGRPSYEIWAQMIERASGFVLLSPLILLTIFI